VSDQVPGGHSLKTEAELAPTSSQKPPAAQDWQSVLPLVGENLPARHGLHWREPVSAWNDPLSHSRQPPAVWLPVSGL